MSRVTRSLTALLVAALAFGCVDATGPVAADGLSLEFAVVGPQPVSPAETAALADAFDLVDSYAVEIVYATSMVPIVDTVLAITPSLDAHVLDIVIPEEALGQTVTITLIAYNGTTELYRSVTTTTLDGELGRVRVELEIRYTGPGIRGAIRDASGAGVDGVTVELFSGATLVGTTTTDVDGSYLFVDGELDLSAGSYTVQPTPPTGAILCPATRDVRVDTGEEVILSDFRTQTDICGTSVLVVSGGDYNDTEAIQTLLDGDPDLEAGAFFYVNALPGLDVLREYDAVLLYMNGLFDESDQLGAQIADYVNLGGNLVVASFYFQGRGDSGLRSVGWGPLEAIDPFTAEDGGATYSAVALDVATIVAHPITSGVTVLTSTSYSSGVTEKSPTTVLARWTDGAPLVGVRTLSGGQRIVAVSLFPAAGVSVTGDSDALWINAVTWAGEAGGPG